MFICIYLLCSEERLAKNARAKRFYRDVNPSKRGPLAQSGTTCPRSRHAHVCVSIVLYRSRVHATEKRIVIAIVIVAFCALIFRRTRDFRFSRSIDRNREYITHYTARAPHAVLITWPGFYFGGVVTRLCRRDKGDGLI